MNHMLPAIKLLLPTSLVLLIVGSNSVFALPKPENDNTGALTREDCLQCEVKYIDSLRLIGVEGSITLALDIDKNGDVQNVRLAQSSGNIQLDAIAIIQVLEWKFKPRAIERKNRIIRVNFAIKGSAKYIQSLKRIWAKAIQERLQIIEKSLQQRRRS